MKEQYFDYKYAGKRASLLLLIFCVGFPEKGWFCSLEHIEWIKCIICKLLFLFAQHKFTNLDFKKYIVAVKLTWIKQISAMPLQGYPH